uniref:Uncharacterized protein n=1 Tax=Oryza punctata TaxID=4537 RepID=A0A0E0L8S9_ORYPU
MAYLISNISEYDIWADFSMGPMQHEVAFLKEFKVLEDKANAIKLDTGISAELARMIKKWIRPGQKLAVGKQEYKTIIEKFLFSGIHYLFDEAVMEVMWGLKYLMKRYLPEETSNLSNEDRHQMSVGMKMVLDRYGFDYIKPEMVNREIIVFTRVLYECDYAVKKNAKSLRETSKPLEEISGIDCQGWDLQKLATALKVLCYPDEEIETGESEKMLSDTEVDNLVNQAPLYKGKLIGRICFIVYEDIMLADDLRTRTLKVLGSHVEKANEAYEAELVKLREKGSHIEKAQEAYEAELVKLPEKGSHVAEALEAYEAEKGSHVEEAYEAGTGSHVTEAEAAYEAETGCDVEAEAPYEAMSHL